MKEIEIFNKSEQHQEQNQKQENKLIGSVDLKRGCKLFSYNLSTGDIEEVVGVGAAAVDFQGNTIVNKKAQYSANYVYFQAINKSNAHRKAQRYLAGEYELAETFEPTKKQPLKFY